MAYTILIRRGLSSRSGSNMAPSLASGRSEGAAAQHEARKNTCGAAWPLAGGAGGSTEHAPMAPEQRLKFLSMRAGSLRQMRLQSPHSM